MFGSATAKKILHWGLPSAATAGPKNCFLDLRIHSERDYRQVWETADDPEFAAYTLGAMYERVRAYTCPRSTTCPDGNPTGTGSRVPRRVALSASLQP